MVKGRLLAIGNWFGAHEVFANLFEKHYVLHDITGVDIKSTDVILFGGGADIFPGFYRQKASRYNGTVEKSIRDAVEEEAFNKAIKAGAKMLGICRGAQLLCALSGGSLIQHVTNHAGNGHNIKTKDGESIFVSSAHHQMMNPFDTKHEMIAWSEERRSTCYLIEKEKNIPIEIESEVVFFPETNSLAIQYHPEFMSDVSRGVEYSRELVSKYLLEK